MEDSSVSTEELFSFDEDEEPSRYPISDMLDEACSIYMAMGVPYEEFWYGDYTRLKYYKRTYELIKRRENEFLWLQGLYFNDALNVNLANAFSKKGASPHKYMEKPIEIAELTEKEKKEKAIRERKKVITFFQTMMSKSKEKDVVDNGRD